MTLRSFLSLESALLTRRLRHWWETALSQRRNGRESRQSAARKGWQTRRAG